MTLGGDGAHIAIVQGRQCALHFLQRSQIPHRYVRGRSARNLLHDSWFNAMEIRHICIPLMLNAMHVLPFANACSFRFNVHTWHDAHFLGLNLATWNPHPPRAPSGRLGLAHHQSTCFLSSHAVRIRPWNGSPFLSKNKNKKKAKKCVLGLFFVVASSPSTNGRGCDGCGAIADDAAGHHEGRARVSIAPRSQARRLLAVQVSWIRAMVERDGRRTGDGG